MMFLRRGISFALKVKPHFQSSYCGFCSKAIPSSVFDKENDSVTNYSSNLHLSPLFPDAKPSHLSGYDIELVDNDAWQLSSGLAQAWREETSSLLKKEIADSVDNNGSQLGKGDPDFDDIDNMRIHGNLFYKIDRDSKEYEEYSFDFHRRKKPSQKKNDPEESKRKQNDSNEAKRDSPSVTAASTGEKLPKVANEKCGLMSPLGKTDSSSVGKKKLRTPTFNQLTGPYHEPFCLDIYISKASVRACIVHRVTSKVVAVAHSISKDMKFDLASTRNLAACEAVGSVLAQRALADDIHDVVYTPRKGERLEGKLQVVLQSIIDNGINMKVKIKQRRQKKSGPRYMA
ncbi:hypothetical protein L484_004462 [Morus notabilis]|uniref:50S ribosomal protein L18 n=1 Tax=Morus notabilis TaxID=981085 RepID=W9QM55_9ROSA|nr:uncharacterized protein LOC21387964 [Morus notabilis]EXB41292.1 hypothetical protein L484_004462 [Morus notabilis]